MTVIEHLVVGVICVSKQGIVVEAFGLMLNCAVCLVNLNFFFFLPKTTVFQRETWFVTNISGNPLCSVDTLFSSLSVTLSNPVEKGTCNQFTV